MIQIGEPMQASSIQALNSERETCLRCPVCHKKYQLQDENPVYPTCSSQGVTRCEQCAGRLKPADAEPQPHVLLGSLLQALRRQEEEERRNQKQPSKLDKYPVFKHSLLLVTVLFVVGVLIAVWAALAHFRDQWETTESLDNVRAMACYNFSPSVFFS